MCACMLTARFRKGVGPLAVFSPQSAVGSWHLVVVSFQLVVAGLGRQRQYRIIYVYRYSRPDKRL